MREHTSMKKIIEVLRLTYELGLNQREIAESACISRSTVQEIQARAKIAKLVWPLSDSETDEILTELLKFIINVIGPS